METLITTLAGDILAAGTVSEAHILLGLFVVTIIALRKTKPAKDQTPVHLEISSKLDELASHLEMLSMNDEIRKNDIESIRNDIAAIKSHLESINIKIN